VPDRAIGRTHQVDGRLGYRQTHPHGRNIVGHEVAVHPELAEQPEVHMADQAADQW
jgi:hypothetical protein